MQLMLLALAALPSLLVTATRGKRTKVLVTFLITVDKIHGKSNLDGRGDVADGGGREGEAMWLRREEGAPLGSKGEGAM